jgi:ribosomal protein S18 acetylase RimI-like enzyme
LNDMTITNQIPVTRRAGTADRGELVTVLSAAFADDPVFEWLVPPADERTPFLPACFAAFAEVFARHDETFVVSSPETGVVGGALWAPPGVAPVHPDDEQAFGERVAEISGAHIERVGIVEEQFAAAHPHEPAWYLQFLAVDPAHQGNGFGSLLLREVLDRADRAGEAAYLEATSALNRALYERHGFRCIADIALPDGPTAYAMWRDPSS